VNRKILVADDSDNIRNVLQLNFEWKGYEVLAAADGEEALRLAERVRPDLIILDVMMPRRNGFQVCRLFKSDPRTAEIPVILLTAKNQKEDRFWGRDCGADEYITKPFNTPTLEKVVERLLKRAETGRRDPDASTGSGALQETMDRAISEGLPCGLSSLALDARALMVHRQKYGEIRHREIFQAMSDALAEVMREARQELVMEERKTGFQVFILAAADRVRSIQNQIVERCNQAIQGCYDEDDREREFVATRDYHTREEIQIPLASLQVERTLLYNQD